MDRSGYRTDSCFAIAMSRDGLVAAQAPQAGPGEVPDAAARPRHLHGRSVRACLRRQDLHLPVARHRGRRAGGRSRQPLRHARLPRVLDGRRRRQGHRPRRRARHQGRPVGGTADVGARRGGEGRQVLPVLSGEGQAGRLPHRRGGRRQARRSVQGASAAADRRQLQHRPGGLQGQRRQVLHVLRRHLGRTAAAVGDRHLQAAKDVYPANDQPALSAEDRAPARDDMLGFAEEPRDVVILDERASR